MSFASVNRWEGGKVRPQRASREAIAALAEDVGVDVEEAESRGVAADGGEPVRPARRPKTKKNAGAAESSASSDTAAMEKMLWSAACSIRGERDAAKFKDYLLPLLFLKRLSDVFDDEMARLEDEYGDADVAREIAEADHGLLRFYLPPEARWAVVSGREPHEWPRDGTGRSTAPRDVGERLTKAVRAVVRDHPSLSGVIDVVDFAGERNGERDVNPAKLAQVVETFSDPDYRLGLADVQPDFLGRAYEFLLRKFAEGSGKSGGEFFTPTEVAFLMAHIMRPKPGDKCHDYACGSAGLLVKLQLVARELDPTSPVPLKLTGQELQAESYATAKMNAIIHDMDVDIARGDTMINPKFKTASGRIETYDIVVANPMWNQPFNPDVFANDPFDRFRRSGGPTSGKGDWAWLQHTLACLNERGRAAVVLDTGAVTRGSGAKHEDKERNIREWFVDNDLIEGVILLPDNLFYNTSAAGVIVVLSRNKPPARKGKIVLLDASRRAKKGRPKNYIPYDDVKDIASAFLADRSVRAETAVVSQEQVQEADYHLLPTRWVRHTATASGTKSIPHLLDELRELNRKDRRIWETNVQYVGEENRMSLPHIRLHGIERWTSVGDCYAITKKPRGLAFSSFSSIPCLPMDAVPNNGSYMPSIVCRHPEDIASGKYFEQNDVIVACITPSFENGKQCIAFNLPAAFGIATTEIIPLHPRDSTQDRRFLFFYLLHPMVRQHMAQLMEGSTGRKRIPQNVLLDLPYPVLSLEDQRAICKVLELVQSMKAINVKRQVVVDELFQALLHALLTGGISAEAVTRSPSMLDELECQGE